MTHYQEYTINGKVHQVSATVEGHVSGRYWAATQTAPAEQPSLELEFRDITVDGLVPTPDMEAKAREALENDQGLYEDMAENLWMQQEERRCR